MIYFLLGCLLLGLYIWLKFCNIRDLPEVKSFTVLDISILKYLVEYEDWVPALELSQVLSDGVPANIAKSINKLVIYGLVDKKILNSEFKGYEGLNLSVKIKFWPKIYFTYWQGIA